MVPSPLALLLALGAAATALAEPLRFVDCGEWCGAAGGSGAGGRWGEGVSGWRRPGKPGSSLQVPKTAASKR